MNPSVHTASPTTDWSQLATAVLNGHRLSHTEGLQILSAPQSQLLTLIDAAYRIRQAAFQNSVQLYFLKNAKSGLCPEDCGDCSQSKVADANIDKYPMLSRERLLAGARSAAAAQAGTYCIVASGRGPTDREVEHVAETVQTIKRETGLHICCCLGLLTSDQAQRLKQAGVDRINHNLNTSRDFHDSICSTHSFQDRIETLRAARHAGLELCAGLIVGMGEQHQDVVDVALELRELQVESIPVNFLHAIEGTPLEAVRDLTPTYCLKVLCLFRFVHPRTEIRISGGREVQLRSLQALGLFPANSMFVSDYLTTAGQPAEQDHQMIRDLGFDVVVAGHESGV
ncbi:MAG: biotin synthase BioB [Planctomycetaceae bacterium]